MITITDARITGDLREATVFYTVLGDADRAGGHRGGAGERQGHAAQPGRPGAGPAPLADLAFVLDNVQDHVKHIDDLLAEARQRDAEVQRLAAGAQYAGDAAAVQGRRRRRRGREDDDDEDEPALRAAASGDRAR